MDLTETTALVNGRCGPDDTSLRARGDVANPATVLHRDAFDAEGIAGDEHHESECS
jgi:hypothetical protein